MRELNRLLDGFIHLIAVRHVDGITRADEPWNAQSATRDDHFGYGVT
jgi:hypothetical protein